MSNHINLVRIKAVANMLAELKKDIVFVGGATTSLYADDRTTEPRPTEDVDVVIELATYREYAELDEKLRDAGFVNDSASGVVCRYNAQGITVDIMPTGEGALGFSNRWYPSGFKEAVSVNIDQVAVKIFSLPYFIASKMEAFDSRGKANYRFSTDFEDIVFVLENNSNASTLLKAAPEELQVYFKERFSKLLKDPNLEEGLTAHLTPAKALVQFTRINQLFKELSDGQQKVKLITKNRNTLRGPNNSRR